MSVDIELIKKRTILRYPFFASVIENLGLVKTKIVKTASTDGKRIYYNEEFMETLDEKEQIFMFAHEVAHVALDHLKRAKGKDLELWNIATDAVINAFLKKDGLKLKIGFIDIPEAINYDAEKLYELLLEAKKKKENKSQDSQSEEQDDSKEQDGESGNEDNSSSTGKDDGENGNESSGKDNNGGESRESKSDNQQDDNKKSDGKSSNDKKENGEKSSKNGKDSENENNDENSDTEKKDGKEPSKGKDRKKDGNKDNETSKDSSDDKKDSDKGSSTDEESGSKDDKKDSGNGSSKDGESGSKDDKKDTGNGSSKDGESDSKDDNKGEGSESSDGEEKKDDSNSDEGKSNERPNEKDEEDNNENGDKKDDPFNLDDLLPPNGKGNTGHADHGMWGNQNSDEQQDEEDKKENNDTNGEQKQEETPLEKAIEKISNMGEKAAFAKNEEKKQELLKKIKEEMEKGMIGNPNSESTPEDRGVKDVGVGAPLIDWRVLLREAVNLDNDWSYKHAYIENGVVRASFDTVDVPETEILLDTSGSIPDILLRNFLKECKHIIKNSRVKVGCFDTRFYGFNTIRTEKDIENMKFYGGGGTSFDVAISSFTRRVENRIIFTDGMARMPQQPMKAIWVVFGDMEINPKGGRIIRISNEQLAKLLTSPRR